MSIKPILFSTPMVRAILAGRKTMTRRVIKPQPEVDETYLGGYVIKTKHATTSLESINLGAYPEERPRNPGDILWVRETWCNINKPDYMQELCYKADAGPEDDASEFVWRPSIFMPREAARIWLRVTGVRAERLQEISEADALHEGVPDVIEGNVGDEIYCPTCHGTGLVGTVHPVSLGYMETECTDCDTAVKRFRNLWDGINAKRGYPWDSSPWVWVIEFERCEKPQEAQ